MKFILTALFLPALLFATAAAQSRTDAALRQVMDQDSDSSVIPTLAAAEHLRRADVYSSNRLFPQARSHWQKILDVYPTDPGMAKALFGIARSYMWERDYAKAVTFFDRVTKSYIDTKEGREALAFTGACYVRLGKNIEAAKTYERYTVMFPNGERIETSYLNIIDAYREAGKFAEANLWVDKSLAKFAGKPTAKNALHARLRMELHREHWDEAVAAADDLLSMPGFGPSMTSIDEVKYLKGFALEKAGKRPQAMAVYSSIPVSYSSYFSGLAAARAAGSNNVRKTASSSSRAYGDYPIVYRTELLANARKRNIDPRFLLAIMKQESTFRAGIKSPAGARGLLQLVFDTALKYNKAAGYPNLQPDDLYNPSINIAVGSEYVAELKDEFGGLYEAIAASYNGGEDNAARWLARSKPKDPGIFTSEIGFAETKAYVGKVMNNYRVYQDLYDENLNRR
jgi:soluble lytic murein transglycosylase